MTGRCFVDANVFVYIRDPRDRRKQAVATSWIEHLWRERIGRTSAQVLSEYYAVVTRKLVPRVPPELAWDHVAELLSWRPQPVDGTLLTQAHQVELRYKISWWDSMVVAAAQLQDCTLLLTENLQDGGSYGSVTARSPFTLEARQSVAKYSPEIAAASRHRPRGRPRHAGPA